MQIHSEIQAEDGAAGQGWAGGACNNQDIGHASSDFGQLNCPGFVRRPVGLSKIHEIGSLSVWAVEQLKVVAQGRFGFYFFNCRN